MNNTTVDALKDVYTELGGSAATVASMQTDAEVIEALSALVGSTIELPAVTSDDNGDVLTVVEGAWAKATPSAGTNTVIFNATALALDPNSKITLGNSKTVKDIKGAVATGASVLVRTVFNSNAYYFRAHGNCLTLLQFTSNTLVAVAANIGNLTDSATEITINKAVVLT